MSSSSVKDGAELKDDGFEDRLLPDRKGPIIPYTQPPPSPRGKVFRLESNRHRDRPLPPPPFCLVDSYSDFNSGTLGATLPDACFYRVSARTGWLSENTVTTWDSKFDLQLLSQCGRHMIIQSSCVEQLTFPPPLPPPCILHCCLQSGSLTT